MVTGNNKIRSFLSGLFWLFPHVNTAYTIFSIKLVLVNLSELCLNGTLSCVDLMDVIMGDSLYVFFLSWEIAYALFFLM